MAKHKHKSKSKHNTKSKSKHESKSNYDVEAKKLMKRLASLEEAYKKRSEGYSDLVESSGEVPEFNSVENAPKREQIKLVINQPIQKPDEKPDVGDIKKLDKKQDKKLDKKHPKKDSKKIIKDKSELDLQHLAEGQIRPDVGEVKTCALHIDKMKKEVSKALIGQADLVEELIRTLLCNAHVLVEGVPGVAKTLAIRALGAVTGCDIDRIQFTVDLLPTDIIGMTSYTPKKGFEVIKGPVFTNFLIADEINRAPPKTQSALIEAMQERMVTIGREDFHIPTPFFVMATENPLENAGVYPLPEAQIDRFLFKVIVGYPKREEEREIMSRNMTLKKFEDFNLKAVLNPKELLRMQEITKRIYLDDKVKNYILEIVEKTRNKDFEGGEYITYGVSPRASIGMFIAAKSRALMEGRNYVIPEDVQAIVVSVLRHRLILSYKATLKNIKSDDLIKNILNEVEVE